MGQAARAGAAPPPPPFSATGAPVGLNPVPPTTSGTGAHVGVALGRSASRSVRDIERENGDTGPAVNPPLSPRHGQHDPGHTAIPGGGQPAAPAAGVAPTVTSFEGTNNTDGVVPPDPNGAVGPNNYVELVNTHYEVFNKSGGVVAGPIETTQLFSRFQNSTSGAQLCYYNGGGDGIALYDRGANRWLISQLAFTDGLFGPQGPYIECIAVSQTSDPAGAYYAYAFLMDPSSLPDYPKIGIFGNSYYLSANMFASVSAQQGYPGTWAFDRSTMLAGGVPQYVSFTNLVSPNFNTILPGNQNGPTAPPPGEPETYVGLDFTNNTTMGIFQFSQVDWTNPGAATWSGPTDLTVAPYNTMCSLSQDCLPQPGTSQLLDAISDRVMQPLSYRNFGDHEAWTLDHTVNVSTTGGSQAGVRWYEIDRPIVGGSSAGQPYTLAQQGNYAPDGNNRWMGSVAMNGNGDMALGYSIGSGSMDPSIAFTGRTKCDPAGQMTVPEGTIEVGSGVQTGYNRWGDYTDMSVDPSDDTTFWYVDEYYGTSSADGWQTRIGSFKVPTCGTDATPPTVSWTSPANSADVHGTVTLSANATDDTSVSSVAFAVNGTPLTTVNAAPYQTTLDTTSYTNGTVLTLKAVATDSANLQTTATETVTVDNSLPTVTINSPSAGLVSGTVNLTATAADAGSSVTQVAWFVDGSPVGTSSTGPSYTVPWTTGSVANGPHTLTAQATDGAGNTAMSAPVNVTVDNGADTIPPTVSWTAPANNTDVHGTVTLSANATDDTSVTSVVFAANSTPIATVTTGNGGSYQTSWSTTTGYADGSQVTLTATATDSAGLQTTATETVTVDNSLPTVSLTPPPAVVTGSVNLTATAGDVGSAITGVDFLVDGTVVGSSGSPFGTTWNSATVGNGSHTLAARAYDGAGNFTTSAGVVVTVDNTAPTVAFTAPASNAFVRGVVTLTATATDDSSVTSVVFKANGVIVATVSGSASPYSTSWTTTGGAYADGTKVTLTATATDLAGLSSTATETVTVDNSLPSVSITAPTAGATVSGSVPLTVTTSDAGSPVAKIEYLVDGNVVATSTTSPFGVMWNSASVANGSHSITARATDGAGNQTTSSAVGVTVNNAGMVMQISSLIENGSSTFSGWRSWANVTVVDQNGHPVSGATVTLSFTGGASATKSCKTGSSGTCSTSNSKVSVPGSATEVVTTTKVTKSGATWNGVEYQASLHP